MGTEKQLDIIIESEIEFRPYDPGPGKPSDSKRNDLKSLIRTHNFMSFPQSGLLLLAKITLKDGSVKHSLLRRNYFSDDALNQQKNDLENLKDLTEDFSSQVEDVNILDEDL